MTYDVDYFIKKFEAIPEDRWTTHKQCDEQGRRCAFGHCYPLNAERSSYCNNLLGEIPEEGDDLVLLLKQVDGMVANINNGDDKRYQQPTPKQRILAALNDVKKLQQKEQPSYPNITKQLAILPKEETPDIIFQKVN